MPDVFLITQEVITVFYIGLILLAIVALTGRFHQKTETLVWFCALLIVNCTCRAIYFGVPNSVWGGGDTPDGAEKGTKVYWTLFVQFCCYSLADWSQESSYIYILRLWHKARCILEERNRETPERVMRWLVVCFGLLEVLLIVLYLLCPFHVVLTVASIGKAIVAVTISGGFVYYLWSLHETMKHATMLTGPCSLVYLCCPCVMRQEVLAINAEAHAAAVYSVESNAVRARRKLARITQLCVVYCACSLIKLGVMLYQVCAITGLTSVDPASWPYLIFCSYFLTECFPNAFVLYTMRKQSKRGGERDRGGSSGSTRNLLVEGAIAGVGDASPMVPSSPLLPAGGGGGARVPRVVTFALPRESSGRVGRPSYSSSTPAAPGGVASMGGFQQLSHGDAER